MPNPKRTIPPGYYCVDSKDPRAVRMAGAPGHTILRTKATRMGDAEALARNCAALPQLLTLYYAVAALNPSCLTIGAGKMAQLNDLIAQIHALTHPIGDAS